MRKFVLQKGFVQTGSGAFLLNSEVVAWRRYEGEWLIKLERGWSAWMVGEQQFHGSTDESFRYNFGKTEFQVLTPYYSQLTSIVTVILPSLH